MRNSNFESELVQAIALSMKSSVTSSDITVISISPLDISTRKFRVQSNEGIIVSLSIQTNMLVDEITTLYLDAITSGRLGGLLNLAGFLVEMPLDKPNIVGVKTTYSDAPTTTPTDEGTKATEFPMSATIGGIVGLSLVCCAACLWKKTKEDKLVDTEDNEGNVGDKEDDKDTGDTGRLDGSNKSNQSDLSRNGGVVRDDESQEERMERGEVHNPLSPTDEEKTASENR